MSVMTVKSPATVVTVKRCALEQHLSLAEARLQVASSAGGEPLCVVFSDTTLRLLKRTDAPADSQVFASSSLAPPTEVAAADVTLLTTSQFDQLLQLTERSPHFLPKDIKYGAKGPLKESGQLPTVTHKPESVVAPPPAAHSSHTKDAAVSKTAKTKKGAAKKTGQPTLKFAKKEPVQSPPRSQESSAAPHTDTATVAATRGGELSGAEDSDEDMPVRKRGRQRARAPSSDEERSSRRGDGKRGTRRERPPSSDDEDTQVAHTPENVTAPEATDEKVVPPVEADVSTESATTNTSSPAKNSRLEKHLVEKSYVDEEGFMVTVNTWESSSSEVPANPPLTTRPAAPVKGKRPTLQTDYLAAAKGKKPTQGKQATMTSFFKKRS